MYVPSSTYRVQFNHQFGFHQAKEIISYLSDLGISAIYASPIFQARKGSMHGYDIVDPNQINSELGGKSAFMDMIASVKKLNMGWIQDFVPNHMAYDAQNLLLMDLLENGPDSNYFHFFDVSWDHPYGGLQGKILAPFLGEFYSESLENGKILLKYDESGLTVNYYNHRFPVQIHSYLKIFTFRLKKIRKVLGKAHTDYVKLLGVLYVLKNIPPKEELNERHDQILFVKKLLWELYSENVTIRQFVDETLQVFNGREGVPQSYDLLHNLLSEQNYRLSFWKVGTEEINYRRFFTINGLISLRVEDREVFNYIHSLLFKLVKDQRIDGVRIDHIDGLSDPSQYIDRLKENIKDCYIVVEKILELSEELPEFWQVQGTTGYDFLNMVNGIFCRKENESKFNKIYRRFIGENLSYSRLAHEKKRLIIGKHLVGDIDNLAHILAGISSGYRYGNDFTLYGLRRALVEILSHFPVYRTYLSPGHQREEDLKYIHQATEKSKQSMPDFTKELDFIQKILSYETKESLAAAEVDKWMNFIMRFQQISSPLMAKGFEDTLLYNYNRLLSLNEVGGDPNKFGCSDIEFHYSNKQKLNRWSYSMNTTSTHDTKRGEDVRARLNVLSELPQEWEQTVRNWSKLNKGKKKKINNTIVPDKNDEYFFYQTLVGAFPFFEAEYSSFIPRIKEYTLKAVREAKVHTAWLKPDTEYEESFLSFVEDVLEFSPDNQFLREFIPFQKKIAFYGVFNSLAQTLLKITAPGLPDFYQGTELWDLNMVDPDNRRPVDYSKRMMNLQEIKKRQTGEVVNYISELLSHKADGRIKLFLIYKALHARNESIDVFENGSYLPIFTAGKYKNNILAFVREFQNKWILTLAPKFLTSLISENELPLGIEIWRDTCIQNPAEPIKWRNVFTDEQQQFDQDIPVATILQHFPVALLVGESR